MNEPYNLISVIRTLLKWKWHIIIATILGAIISLIVVLFFMKEFYLAYSIVYPTNQSMSDRTTIFAAEGSGNPEAYYYGNKHDVNRILSVANASWLYAHIIDSFNLEEHYGFSEGTAYLATKTSEKFGKLYKAYKTDKEAVRIDIIDEDPDLAANIVNYVVDVIEAQVTKPIIKNKVELRDLFIKKVGEKETAVTSFEKNISNLNPSSASYKLKQSEYEKMLTDLNELRNLRDEYILAADKHIPGLEIVERAFPAEKEIKPVESKICVATVLITFFVACLLALVLEQLNWIRKELENDPA